MSVRAAISMSKRSSLCATRDKRCSGRLLLVVSRMVLKFQNTIVNPFAPFEESVFLFIFFRSTHLDDRCPHLPTGSRERWLDHFF